MQTSIEAAINEFLEINPDYRNDYQNFIIFFNSQSPPISLYNDIVIRGMNTATVIKSLKYLVEAGTFRKQEAAKKYCTTIQELFLFLYGENESWRGDKFTKELGASLKDPTSYKHICKDYIENCDKLEKKESFDPMDKEIVIKLIRCCDKAIEKGLSNQEAAPERISFKNMVSSLCVKLMLLSGCAYRTVRNLRLSDIDEYSGWIAINGHEILLPPLLNIQFKLYKKYRLHHSLGIREDSLFCDLVGRQWGEKTSDSNVPTFLNSRIGKTDLTSISKYGITQMMLQDVSDGEIMQVTGANKDVMENCRLACGSIHRYTDINSKLMRTDFYKADYASYLDSPDTINRANLDTAST